MNNQNENYVMEIKGSGHPDVLCDTYADILVEEMQKYDPDIHVNADNSYLKSGKFPKFVYGGNVSYDFDNNPYDHLSEAMYRGKKRIIGHFKEKFNNAAIDFTPDFDIGRNELEFATSKKLMGDTSYVTAFYPLNGWESVLLSLSETLENETKKENTVVGSDYKLMLVVKDGVSKLVIAQCFIKDTDRIAQIDSAQDLDEYKNEILETYHEIIEDHMDDFDEVVINNSEPEFGFYWNKFGSSVFKSDCGSVGRANDYYGFNSPYRPSNNEAGHGKALSHPASQLYEMALNRAKELHEKDEKDHMVTIVSIIGSPLEDSIFIEN